MANPTLLTSPIAENGDKNVIPASTGATTGLLDQEHGFQQINELPLQAGGLPPQRKDFNGIFNLLSGILYMTQRGYTFEFDNTLPYVVGCIVRDTDGKLYRCINDVAVGGTQPSLDSTNWVINDFSAYLPLNGGGALTGSSLTWNGNNLGDMAIVASSIAGSGYIKTASGFLIQWGTLLSASAETLKSVGLPLTYADNTYNIQMTLAYAPSTHIDIYSNDKSWFNIRYTNPIAGSVVHWLTFGKG